MLERIKKITSIGLFNDIKPSGVKFKKVSLIYGDNGRGKSTFASILRSYANSEPNIIIQRKTLDSQSEQFVDILFSDGNISKFENNSWTKKYSDIHIFDLDFIDNNVYSGSEIKPGQRKNLLSFALGRAAVTAMTEFNSANEIASECTQQKKLIAAALNGYRGEMTLTKYVNLAKKDNVDDLLLQNSKKQEVANRVKIVKAKNKSKNITTFKADLADFFNVMNKTVEKINESAEKKVKTHLNIIDSDDAERWISQGQGYIKNDTCPFCCQNISQSDLTAAYKDYFNKEYSDFIQEVLSLPNKKDTILNKLNIPLIYQEYKTASENFTAWEEFISLSLNGFKKSDLVNLKNQLDTLLSECITIKSAEPLKIIEQARLDACTDLVTTIDMFIRDINDDIDLQNNKIEEYKNSIEVIDIEALQKKHDELNFNKIRHSDEVVQLISDYQAKKNEEKAANNLKEQKRTTLNQIMIDTLGKYEKSINSLLLKFGALFSIKEIAYNYNGGGVPKSEYAIELRGKKISLQGEDSGFKTCLSEGDKRTLAFAFFISVIISDAELNNKIVIIDDPMCSFDSHRKQQTITVLKEIYDKSKQLIVLAHDAFFIKTLRNEFNKKGASNDISLIKINYSKDRFSQIDSLDIDSECESAYYKNHRLVSEYCQGLGNNNERDVAIAIRPLLEGYLHRRFPTYIESGFLFGNIVQLIAASNQDSPLYHAISLVDELNEINSYAGKFHHDTNPSAGNEMVAPGELRSFCCRALNIIYKGTI